MLPPCENIVRTVLVVFACFSAAFLVWKGRWRSSVRRCLEGVCRPRPVLAEVLRDEGDEKRDYGTYEISGRVPGLAVVRAGAVWLKVAAGARGGPTVLMERLEALTAGELYRQDVPESDGQKYPPRKARVLAMVPPGGYWRDLPVRVQKAYLKGSYNLPGGKTGMTRRLSWNAPSLTLTCALAQNQTERCHPEENRPLTVREYARIQTFPDDWEFAGSIMMQYRQIGNAVPVNLAECIGHCLVRALNGLEPYHKGADSLC